MRSKRLDNAKAYTDLLLIRLYQKLRAEAGKAGWKGLQDLANRRIGALEDEYARLTGKRIGSQ